MDARQHVATNPADTAAANAAPQPTPRLPEAAAAPKRPSKRIVAEYFVAATAFLVIGSAGLVWVAPELARGTYLAPHVGGVTHLFTLGWLTLMILGALCQIVPVALGAPLRWPWAARAACWTLVPGVASMAVGIAMGSLVPLLAGVVLVAIGVTLAVANLVGTLARSPVRDVTWRGLGLGLGFLVLTLVLGLVLADNLRTSVIATARIRVLAAHLHVALVGWVFMVVVAISHRLLPTFLASRTVDAGRSTLTLILLAAGVPTLTIGLIVGVPVVTALGVVLIETAVVRYLWQAFGMFRGSGLPHFDVSLKFVGLALLLLAGAAVLGPLLFVVGTAHIRLATAYIVTIVPGVLTLFVIGFMYRIVPSLTWATRYAGRLGRARVPGALDLYSHRLAAIQMGISVLALVLILLGIALRSVPVARAGTLLFLTGSLIFAYQLAGVLWRTPAAFRVTGGSP